jgi:hypothetical protein
LIDFQVQAVTGYYAITQKPGYIPGAPTQAQSGNGYEEITFNPAESSDWSNTQTVNLNETSTTPTPILTNNKLFLTITLSAIGIAIIILLVMAVKRRKSKLANTTKVFSKYLDLIY